LNRRIVYIVGLVVFLTLFHPVDSYALQLGRTEAIEHIHKFGCIPSSVNICVCDNSIIANSNFTFINRLEYFVRKCRRYNYIVSSVWGYRGRFANDNMRAFGGCHVTEKGCVSMTKIFSWSFSEVSYIYGKLRGCVAGMLYANPCPIFNNEITIGKINASFCEFQRFPCLLVLGIAYNYIGGKSSESQEDSESTNVELFTAIALIFNAIGSALLSACIVLVHGRYRYVIQAVLISCTIVAYYFFGLFLAYSLGYNHFII
jgi:hypothetical protein